MIPSGSSNISMSVIEYLPGGSLEDLLQMKAPLPVDDAVRIALDICEALEKVHDRGIVHGDLKPANILFAADGARVELGGAELHSGMDHVSEQAPARSRHTPTGQAGAMLPYMPPEQLDGQRDDPRSDLYALGAILYRMLTGRPYLDFDPSDTPDTEDQNIQRIRHEQPQPPSTHNPRVPRWLDDLLVKVLAKEPKDRHASAGSLRTALLGPESEPVAPRLAPEADPGTASSADHVRSTGPRRFRPPTSAQRSVGEDPVKEGADAAMGTGRRARTIRWLTVLLLCLFLLFVVLVAILAPRLYRGDFAPAPVTSQVEDQVGLLMEQAGEAFTRGDLDLAEEKCREVLNILPDHIGAEELLEWIQFERESHTTYADAAAFQFIGEYEAALQRYSELEEQRAGYRDVSQRIEECRQEILKEEIFASAEADYAAGLREEALARYESLRQLDPGYEAPILTERLYTLHLELGRALLLEEPPEASVVPMALDHFNLALTYKPRDSAARREQAIALSFLAGQEHYQAERWSGAIDELQSVYDQRPGCLGGLAAQMLYEATISLGDVYLGGGGLDCARAYTLYSQALELQVPSKSVAQQRMRDTFFVCIGPSITPSDTPSPSVTTSTDWATRWAARQTPPGTPSLAPTTSTDWATRWAAQRTPPPAATPWNLRALHNQIIFLSSESPSGGENPEVWVMDPDGGNRRYLGDYETYEGQLAALRDEYAHSPDGRYRVYTNESAQLAMISPDGSVRQLTHFDGVCYDPAWSPDGSRIAFTSNENGEQGGDDIWVMDPDGAHVQWLTKGTWEWDKHPSWSPDSRRIAFWSNRNGLMQIYVMDSEGQYQTNISQSQSYEWDPLWIR